MKRSIAYGWFIGTMLLTVAPTVLGQQGGPARFHVDCDGGGPKLSQAIELAKPGDTIVVRGTCRERIKVTRGPLILDGGGNAILDGAGVGPNEQEFNGLLTVDGAHGVTIRGWLIRNSTGEGIFGVHGANMVIQDTVVEENFTGIGLSNSAAEVVDTATRLQQYWSGCVFGFDRNLPRRNRYLAQYGRIADIERKQPCGNPRCAFAGQQQFGRRRHHQR